MSEAKYYFIHASTWSNNIKNPLKINIKNKIIETHMDERGRIWLGEFRKFVKIYRGSRVKLIEAENGNYTLLVAVKPLQNDEMLQSKFTHDEF